MQKMKILANLKYVLGSLNMKDIYKIESQQQDQGRKRKAIILLTILFIFLVVVLLLTNLSVRLAAEDLLCRTGLVTCPPLNEYLGVYYVSSPQSSESLPSCSTLPSGSTESCVNP